MGTGIFIGLILGFMLSVFTLNNFYRVLLKIKIKEISDNYVKILKIFGIKKNKNGVFVMHRFDQEDIWSLRKDIKEVDDIK